jgi:hypothetical protein
MHQKDDFQGVASFQYSAQYEDGYTWCVDEATSPLNGAAFLPPLYNKPITGGKANSLVSSLSTSVLTT